MCSYLHKKFFFLQKVGVTLMQGNHEERNQQANLPLFNIEMMSKRKWDNYRFTSRRELHVYSP
jgi:hypothetical protein